jgi:hypothetical protein
LGILLSISQEIYQNHTRGSPSPDDSTVLDFRVKFAIYTVLLFVVSYSCLQYIHLVKFIQRMVEEDTQAYLAIYRKKRLIIYLVSIGINVSFIVKKLGEVPELWGAFTSFWVVGFLVCKFNLGLSIYGMWLSVILGRELKKMRLWSDAEYQRREKMFTAITQNQKVYGKNNSILSNYRDSFL